jgi:hypothetical protein
MTENKDGRFKIENGNLSLSIKLRVNVTLNGYFTDNEEY